MDSSKRVVLNTSVQHLKTAINLVLSLISTRIILSALGVEDFGLFNLTAGVVALLSFIVNALVVTTQRYLSYYSGKNNITKLRSVFSNSLIIHISLGVVLSVIIGCVGVFLFNGFLNINPNRLNAAIIVYMLTVFMLLITFITAPFRALLISHENIVYISIIDILDGALKLIIAFIVVSSSNDKLIEYTFLLVGIQLINFIAFCAYDFRNYSECIVPRLNMFDISFVKEISKFAGWTIYSVGCIAGRNQGLSIVLNKFGDVVMNAAYGVATQVNGALSFLSQSIQNAMNPQIMKAEGAGNRKKMIRLSEMESKFCFLLMAMVLIPCVVEMPAILKLWLHDVPEHSVMFCRIILIASMADQLTVGLGAANQAIGDIRQYSIYVNTFKLLTIVLVVLGFLSNIYIGLVMSFYIIIEFLCSMIRLIYLRKTANISILGFCKRVFMREIIPICISIISSWLIIHFFSFGYRFIATILFSSLSCLLSIMVFGLCSDEKEIIKKMIYRK